MKGYTVFNVEQIEGLPEHYTAKKSPRLNPDERIAHAEEFFGSTGADIRSGGDRAFYAPQPDFVQMPDFESFKNAGSYYATLAHELTHWTKHDRRLARDFGGKKWGDEAYAMEELVAELGAAFLCADLELTPQIRDDHAPYIDGWLRAMKSDKRAIFTAAAHAQRAADFMHSLQPVIEETAKEGVAA
ncbi:ArdC family protein [Aliiruegeria lutimaris]